MADQPNMKMPKDAAQLVLWFKGLPQPTAFLTLRDDAEKVKRAFVEEPRGSVTFLSYPDGRGVRSESVFACEDLRGVTVEYPTIQLVGGA